MPTGWALNSFSMSHGSLAAHWEHTVVVRDAGLCVLTAVDGGAARLAELGVPFAPVTT